MQQVISLLLVGKHVNIELELELVTTYLIRFIVKLLWKCCGCSIAFKYIELKFLWFSSKAVQHFYYGGQNMLILFKIYFWKYIYTFFLSQGGHRTY